jgi:hypothetical protein
MFFMGILTSQPGMQSKMQNQARRLRLALREALDPAVAAVQNQAQGP